MKKQLHSDAVYETQSTLSAPCKQRPDDRIEGVVSPFGVVHIALLHAVLISARWKINADGLLCLTKVRNPAQTPYELLALLLLMVPLVLT